MEADTRILLLDDEPLPRMMAAMVLRRMGAIVTEAGTCEEALQLARGSEFDAAVLDHRLPDGYGIDLVRTLRQEGAAFPVVMLSGEAADITCDAEAGICAVLEKPLEAEPLLAALAEATGLEKAATEKIGNYRLWNPEEPSPADDIDYLALDFSNWHAETLPESVVGLIRQPRRSIAVVGATEPLRAALAEIVPGVGIEYVVDEEELAALSRRPTSPLERLALLGS